MIAIECHLDIQHNDMQHNGAQHNDTLNINDSSRMTLIHNL
jgi:hypothetical protein